MSIAYPPTYVKDVAAYLVKP